MVVSLRKIVALALLSSAQMMGICVAHERGVDAGSVKAFLRSYFKGPEDKTTRYSAAPVMLDAKGDEILVYVTGRFWCGSGGCMALLLRPADGSFKVIDRFTLVRLPIVVLSSKTNGWHDIAMSVEGGGIVPGRMAILRFDGHKYPSNPSMAPRLPTRRAGTGKKVPLSEHGSLVY